MLSSRKILEGNKLFDVLTDPEKYKTNMDALAAEAERVQKLIYELNERERQLTVREQEVSRMKTELTHDVGILQERVAKVTSRELVVTRREDELSSMQASLRQCAEELATKAEQTENNLRAADKLMKENTERMKELNRQLDAVQMERAELVDKRAQAMKVLGG